MKDVAEPGRQQMTVIRHMCFACWITKATDTHSEYVILIAFIPQQWLSERAPMLLPYVHCLSCSFNLYVPQTTG
jgi:hypothetical protein